MERDLKRFGPQIDKFTHSLLAQRGVEWEGATKVVPIISLGRGTHVGAAQVVGPADKGEAAANRLTPDRLAEYWRNNLRAAVGGTATGGADGEPTYVTTANKMVPILSLGTGGRVGVAMVAGESHQVAQVKAVAQIEGDFKNRVRVQALVPIGREDVSGKIERIARTSVTGYADIRL